MQRRAPPTRVVKSIVSQSPRVRSQTRSARAAAATPSLLQRSTALLSFFFVASAFIYVLLAFQIAFYYGFSLEQRAHD
jgi:hypothetical protein